MLEINEVTIALLVLAIILAFILSFQNKFPDIPFIRLISQAEVGKTRVPEESAIYRSRHSLGGLSIPLKDGVKTTHDIFQRGLKNSSNKQCLGIRISGSNFVWLSYKEVSERIKNFGSGLLNLNVPPQSKIGLYAPNSPEYIIADQACVTFSMIPVCMEDKLTNQVLEHIINETQLTVLIISNDQFEQVAQIFKNCSSLKFVIVYSSDGKGNLEMGELEVKTFKQVEELGKSNPQDPTPPKPESIAMINYSRGSTGIPKGVVFTHKNIVSTLAGLFCTWPQIIAPTQNDCYYSYFPMSLPIERLLILGFIFCGGSIGFGTDRNVNTIFDDMKLLKPSHFVSVPHIWNIIYEKINNAINDSGYFGKALFQFIYKRRKANLSYGILGTNKIWDRLIFKNIQTILGGNIKFMISVYEPVDPDVLDFLRICFGCNVLEGYGLTEALFCSMSIYGDYEPGHVGPPIACNEIKLIDVPTLNFYVTDKPNPRGEICIRGPNVFKEYVSKTAEGLKKVDENSWLHTDDIGEILPNGVLKFISKKSEILSFDKDQQIIVSHLESIYSQSRFVSQIFITLIGEMLLAVIVPKESVLVDWGKQNQVSGDIQQLCQNEKFQTEVRKSLNQIASQKSLKPFENVKCYLEPTSFEENGLLTSTFQIKRTFAHSFYEQKLISSNPFGPF